MSMILLSDGVDSGAVWHCGEPFAEQRAVAAGTARVDLSHRDQLLISGPERLTWLHALTSQAFVGLQPGQWTDALILDAHGKIRFGFTGLDDGEAFRLHTEPGQGEALQAWLARMIFMTRVEVTAVSGPLSWGADGWAFASTSSASIGGGSASVVSEGSAGSSSCNAGLWAFEALRIAQGLPRVGLDTDERTIPNELGLFGTALDKGCYPGQETVGRTHTLGRPPRRLVRLSLDGSEDRLPALGSELVLDGKVVGRVGSSALHYEEGPIALGLVKRNVDPAAQLLADGIPTTQEALVDPDVGLHVRPRL